MKAFIRCSNNGITAVISGDDYERLRTGQVHPAPTYFTFTHEAFLAEQPWLTGSYELMDRLLDGHLVAEKSFNVPFSNKEMHRLNDQAIRSYLLRYSATLEQVIEAFGVSIVKKEPRTRIEGCSRTT